MKRTTFMMLINLFSLQILAQEPNKEINEPQLSHTTNTEQGNEILFSTP